MLLLSTGLGPPTPLRILLAVGISVAIAAGVWAVAYTAAKISERRKRTVS